MAEHREPAAPSVASLEQEIRRLRDCIVSARWRLTKGRALWNGPCHECDAALHNALTGREPPHDTRRAVIEECARWLRDNLGGERIADDMRRALSPPTGL